MSNTLRSEISDILQEVKASIDPIEKLIAPTDLIQQDVTFWFQVDYDLLKSELYGGLEYIDIYQSRSIYQSHSNEIRDISILLYLIEVPRIPFEHLVFDDRETCLIEGYWVNDMSNNEAREILHDNYHKLDSMVIQELESDAYDKVSNAIIEKQLVNLKEVLA